MGTRGITKVIHNDEVKVLQYGQWDHYPSGQGVTALKFLRNPNNVADLIKGLDNVYYPTDAELQAMGEPYTKENGMMTMEQGEKFSADYPSLTRDTGAGILEVIASAEKPLPLAMDYGFEDDELWCEGVYTINLDTRTFTTKWDNQEYSFSFDELVALSDTEYAKRCSDPVPVS